MPLLQVFRTMVDYNYALFDRVWESMLTLSEEQFTREVDYSQGSLRNQIVHVAGVDGRWLRGLKGLPNPRNFNPLAQDYPGLEAAHALWNRVAGEVRGYVLTLDEQLLAAKAPEIDEPAWQILAHLVNHGTDHRAQMLRQLYDLGAPTFPQDLIFYLWEQTAGKM